MDAAIRLFAPAKLNLALDITGLDGKGYHLLDGVMLRIDLCDRILLSMREDGAVRVSCDTPGIPQDEGNLAAVAARRFFSETGTEPVGFSIHIEKGIPSQAGLGGGSADAAAVLDGLNRLTGTGLSEAELMRIGLTVGADVPFCLRGGCARARGRGERLDPLPMPPGWFFVVAKPAAGMSTRAAFARYDECRGELPRPDVAGMMSALEKGDLAAIGRAMGNVFEALCEVPEVGMIKAEMLEQGALGASMTGTGTAVAGLFADHGTASTCASRLRDKAAWISVARPTGTSGNFFHI